MEAVALAMAAIVGAIVGSFVGAIVTRWPAGRSVVAGRSRCDGCGRRLRAGELIPIVSYVTTRGRCRSCGCEIDIDQPVAELLGAAACVIAFLSANDLPEALALAGYGWTLIALALLDLRHRWLPDRLTLPLLATGLAVAAVSRDADPVDRIGAATLGWLLLEAVRLAYRRLRGIDGMGGGDPKLMAAIAAWTGIALLGWILAAASVLGILIVAGRLMIGNPISRSEALPFGALLAAAGFLVIPVERLLA